MGTCSHRGLAGHLHSCLQELIEVLPKFAGGLGQVLRGATRCLHQLVGRLVEPCSCSVQLTLRLLEILGAGRELEAGRGVRRGREEDGDGG